MRLKTIVYAAGMGPHSLSDGKSHHAAGAKMLLFSL